jgi:hypothetical protein
VVARDESRAHNRPGDAPHRYSIDPLDTERLGELTNVLATTPFTAVQMESTTDTVLPVPQDDSHERSGCPKSPSSAPFRTGGQG